MFYCFGMFVNKIFNISCVHISKSKRCFNMKSSKCCFHMKTKILADYQIGLDYQIIKLDQIILVFHCKFYAFKIILFYITCSSNFEEHVMNKPNKFQVSKMILITFLAQLLEKIVIRGKIICFLDFWPLFYQNLYF